MLYCRTLRIATVAMLAALAACQSKETGRGASDSAVAAKPDLTSQPAFAGANVVTVTATEYKFDAPAAIPAGLTTIRLVSQGRELHHVQLIKLEDGKTLEDFVRAAKASGPPPKWAVDAGGPNPPRPGGGVAEITERLEPGNYVIACFVPSADGTPHIAKGMLRPLTVTPATGTSAPEPTADVVMTLKDYSFELSTPLTPGRHIIRIDNAGPQSHELVLARLAPGKTAGDLAAWAEKMVGPPPAEPLGGVSGIRTGGHAYMVVDLAPGDYGFLCFVPDAKDGKPHVAHGMVKQVKVGGSA